MRKPRKFNRHLASKIMAGKVKGRIRTRDGRPVRILAWDAMGDYPIVGLIFLAEIDTEMSWQWTKQGIAFGHSDYSSTVVENNAARVGIKVKPVEVLQGSALLKQPQ